MENLIYNRERLKQFYIKLVIRSITIVLVTAIVGFIIFNDRKIIIDQRVDIRAMQELVKTQEKEIDVKIARINEITSMYNKLVDINNIPKHIGGFTVDIEDLSYIPDACPMNPLATRESSKWGMRYSPKTGRLQMHYGIDMYSLPDAPVFTTATGVVKKVVYNDWIYGNYIVIDHGNNYETKYAHLSRIYVKEGDVVHKGLLFNKNGSIKKNIKNQRMYAQSMIGRQGSSGLSTGEHLHYEVHYNGLNINPDIFLSCYFEDKLDTLVSILNYTNTLNVLDN